MKWKDKPKSKNVNDLRDIPVKKQGRSTPNPVNSAQGMAGLSGSMKKHVAGVVQIKNDRDRLYNKAMPAIYQGKANGKISTDKD